MEKAIERTESKRILATRKKRDNDIPHRISVKDKELDNAKFQLQGYEKEIAGLQRRIDEISQVDKMLDSEQLLKEYNTQCTELRKQIKDLEKLSKDKGKALEKLTDGDDYNYKIRNMIDEVRMWKEKIKHRQEIYEKNENGLELKSDRMNTLEKENQSLMDQIQNLNSNINLDPISKPKKTKENSEIEVLMEDKKRAKEELEQKQKENRLEIGKLKKEVESLQNKRDILMTRVKELNQEQRISTFKLKEVGRVLKHNQLKPLSPSKVQTDVEGKRSDLGSKKSRGMRGSTTNLLEHQDSSKKIDFEKNATKKLDKGGNTQSTKLLNNKQYSKTKRQESEDEFEKNQVIEYDKFKKQQDEKEKVKLGSIKPNAKGSKNVFETKTSLK